MCRLSFCEEESPKEILIYLFGAWAMPTFLTNPPLICFTDPKYTTITKIICTFLNLLSLWAFNNEDSLLKDILDQKNSLVLIMLCKNTKIQ